MDYGLWVLISHDTRFETIEFKAEGQVLMGNNKACRVLDKGNIKFQMYDGLERTLTDVRYVPNLKRNLISLGMLDKNGYTFTAKDGFIKVTKGSLVVMQGVRRNGIYTIFGKM